MESNYKINILEPCNEDWNKMTPTENGRFCGSCTKNIVDFTTMLPDDIKAYFLEHNNICGRFKKSQLDTLTIQIPSRVLYSQTQYHKIFLLALFVAMGTTIFSCADKSGNKQKIDKVEIVADSIEIKNTIVGMRLPPKHDKNNSLQNNIPPPPPPKKAQVKFVKTPKSKVNSPVTKPETAPTKAQKEEIIYMGEAIYTDPEYKGGMEKFKDYIQSNYVFPTKTNIINAEIQASFVTERDGSLSNIKLLKDVENDMGKELTRLLEKSEKWIPGTQNGKMVRNLYSITLIIKTDTLKTSFLKNRLNQRIDSIIIKHNLFD
jgi:hypothetical protein